MYQYKIVCLTNRFQEMANTYPNLPKMLYSSQNDQYQTKQIEHLFLPIAAGKEQLLKIISQREDYSYYHGTHTLTNEITNEKIVVHMNEYDIEVTEMNENHVIFDMIKPFSKNFYMIKP